jgi:hypothetical protein
VTVGGSASRVSLVGGVNGREAVPGQVPPGTYTVEADFPDQAGVVAGKLTLAPGGAARIECDAFFGQCKIK